jgi:hypothetical protein
MLHHLHRYFFIVLALITVGRSHAQEFCRTADRHNFTSTKQSPITRQLNGSLKQTEMYSHHQYFTITFFSQAHVTVIFTL